MVSFSTGENEGNNESGNHAEGKPIQITKKRMSVFLSNFLFLFGALAFAVALAYWQQGNYRGNWFALGWGSVGFILLGIGAGFAFYAYVIQPSKNPPENPKERPYVFISNTRLAKPFAVNEKPVVKYVINNSGPVGVVGSIKDMTFTFTIDANRTELEYSVDKNRPPPVKFSLAPAASMNATSIMEFALNEARVNAINDGTGRLFFFARGEYASDSGGKTYPLSMCFVFNKDHGDFVLCDSQITVK